MYRWLRVNDIGMWVGKSRLGQHMIDKARGGDSAQTFLHDVFVRLVLPFGPLPPD